MGGYREVNYTTDKSGKFVLLTDSQIDELKVDGIRNEIWKQVLNAKKMKKQKLCGTLRKSVEDKVPNVTNEEIIRK